MSFSVEEMVVRVEKTLYIIREGKNEKGMYMNTF